MKQPIRVAGYPALNPLKSCGELILDGLSPDPSLHCLARPHCHQNQPKAGWSIAPGVPAALGIGRDRFRRCRRGTQGCGWAVLLDRDQMRPITLLARTAAQAGLTRASKRSHAPLARAEMRRPRLRGALLVKFALAPRVPRSRLDERGVHLLGRRQGTSLAALADDVVGKYLPARPHYPSDLSGLGAQRSLSLVRYGASPGKK